MDTGTLRNVRAVNSGLAQDVTDSQIFKMDSTNFGVTVNVGEFGGAHVGRLLVGDTRGGKIAMVGVNCEATFEEQGVLLSDGFRFSYRYGRFNPLDTTTATDSFVSVDTTVSAGEVDLSGSAIESKRHLEYYGGDYSPFVTSPTKTAAVDGQAGAAIYNLDSFYLYPRQRYYTGNVLPISGNLRGEKLVWARNTAATSTNFIDAHLVEAEDVHAGTGRWFQTINENALFTAAVSNYTSHPMGTSEELSYAMPANRLGRNGMRMEGYIAGTFAATGDNKQILIKDSASTVFDSGTLTTNGGYWELIYKFQGDTGGGRKASTTVKLVIVDGSSTQTIMLDNGQSSFFESAASTIHVEFECAVAGGITSQGGSLEWRNTVDELPSAE